MLRVLPLDWHTAGRWGSLFTLPRLLAGEDGLTPPLLPRYVLRFACLRCEQHYLSTDPEAQPCPACGRLLAYVASWDLLSEYAPRWWMADPLDPGERP
jgi:hypothetical protein